MKALIVLNAYSVNKDCLYKARRLEEELLKRSVETDIVRAEKLPVRSYGDFLDMDFLDGYSFAIDLDKDLYLAKALSQRMPLFNSYESFRISDDKMLSILELDKSGVKTPLTISCPLCYSEIGEETVKRFLDDVEEKLGYPLVYKQCHGSLGKQVLLIHDRKELKECYLKNKGIPHLYEKYLSANSGRDYRVIVIGDRVVAVMERENRNDFRSNIALGGKGTDVTETVSPGVKETALKAAEALKLDYAGIDIGIDNDGNPTFLEANGNAFFTEIEKVTGMNIAGDFVEYILERI